MRTLPPLYVTWADGESPTKIVEGFGLNFLIKTACLGRAPIEVCTQEWAVQR
jgi:hypothetical protein